VIVVVAQIAAVCAVLSATILIEWPHVSQRSGLRIGLITLAIGGWVPALALVHADVQSLLGINPHSPPLPQIEQAVIAAILALILVRVPIALRARSARTVTTLGLCVALVPALLRVAFPFSFLHVEQFGDALLADITSFPAPSYWRATWGQTSFFLLGLAADVAGTWRGALALNALVSTATVVCAGALVWRWTGSQAAAVATVLAAALNPALVRVAASEEAGNLAMAAALSAMWAVDAFALAPHRRAALGTAALMLVLAVWTRQSAMLFLPIVALMMVERGGRRLLARTDVRVAMATVALAALAQIAFSHFRDHRSLAAILAILPDAPRLLWDEPHPLFDIAITPAPLLPALAWGLVTRRNGARATLRFGVVLLFAATALFGFGGRGLQIAYRAPLLLVACIAAGVGAGDLFDRLRVTHPRWSWSAAASSLALYVACASVGLVRLAPPDPLAQELAFLEEAVPRLPHGATIVTQAAFEARADLSAEEPGSEWSFPIFLGRERDLHVMDLARWRRTGAGKGGCALFYRGLLCYSLGPGEASPTFRATWGRLTEAEASDSRDKPDAMRAMVQALHDQDRRADWPVDLLTSRRPNCWREVPAQADAWQGLETTLRLPTVPFPEILVYPHDEMPVGFYPLGGAACH